MTLTPSLAGVAPQERTVPQPIFAHDFLTMTFPPRGMLLSPWLPEKGLALIAGPRGLGKTHLALGIAHAVACGGEFLRWRAERARRTLYIDGEMPAISLQERLAQIVRLASSETPRDTLAFLVADQCEYGLPDLSTCEGQEALRPRLEPFDLVVFDNLSTLCRSGRENDAESWAQVQAFALDLRRANKSAIFIHHTGKKGTQRGSSKREDVLDSVLLLRSPDDDGPRQGARFVVEFSKHRGFFGGDAEPFEAALDPRTGLWRATAIMAGNDDAVVALRAQGLSVRAIGKELEMSKSAVGRVLRRAATDS